MESTQFPRTPREGRTERLIFSHDLLHHEPSGLISGRGNAPLGSKELIRFALNYLPPYKIPKSIEFTDHIPVNENGKIVRSKLIEESLAKGY